MSRTRLSFIRPFTNRVVNPIARLVAGRLPGFGIVHCRGRRSGRAYRIPMNVFRDGDAWVFALTYGSEAQWVRNVLAAGACTLETRGRRIELGSPEVIVDPTRRLVPRPVRWFLGPLGVDEFLRLRPVP